MRHNATFRVAQSRAYVQEYMSTSGIMGLSLTVALTSGVNLLFSLLRDDWDATRVPRVKSKVRDGLGTDLVQWLWTHAPSCDVTSEEVVLDDCKVRTSSSSSSSEPEAVESICRIVSSNWTSLRLPVATATTKSFF